MYEAKVRFGKCLWVKVTTRSIAVSGRLPNVLGALCVVCLGFFYLFPHAYGEFWIVFDTERPIKSVAHRDIR